jgi:AcrR family transcriptional regulator
MPAGKTVRAYRSPLREARAERTRQALLAAARRRFERAGYFAAALDDIAADAGVSVQRLYAVFGSKSRLLLALIRALKAEVRVDERARALIADRSATRKLAAVAALTRLYCERGLDVLEAAREAARTDRGVRRVWREVEGWRHQGNLAVVRSLAAVGALAPALDEARATDVLWTLTAHDLYRLLVRERGWSPERYEAWLAGALARELVA